MQEPTCEQIQEQYRKVRKLGEDYIKAIHGVASLEELDERYEKAFEKETALLRSMLEEKEREKQKGISYLSPEYHSGREYEGALDRNGHRLNVFARDLLDQLTTIPEEQVRLKRVSGEDLGFTEGYTFEEILITAQDQGLEPCPLWVGPQYRLKCDGKEEVFIYTEHLINLGNPSYYFFDVDHDLAVAGTNLFIYEGHNYCGYEDPSCFEPEQEWIFISPKETK